MVIVALLVSSACSGGESASSADGGLLGISFETVSDAVRVGDFAVVFDVVSERDVSFADISRPADGSPPTSPPTIPDDDYVGRVVRVTVVTEVWDHGEKSVPSEFEFVTAGWELRDGSRHPADDGPWYRVDVGGRYFGVFTDFGGEIGPMSINAVYGMDGDRLVEVSSAGGPEPFDGATIAEVAELLDNTAAAFPAESTP